MLGTIRCLYLVFWHYAVSPKMWTMWSPRVGSQPGERSAGAAGRAWVKGSAEFGGKCLGPSLARRVGQVRTCSGDCVESTFEIRVLVLRSLT